MLIYLMIDSLVDLKYILPLPLLSGTSKEPVTWEKNKRHLNHTFDSTVYNEKREAFTTKKTGVSMRLILRKKERRFEQINWIRQRTCGS